MKIAAAQVELAASHQSLSVQQESLRFERRPAPLPPPPPSASVNLSPEGQAAASTSAVKASEDEQSLDPRMAMLKQMIEAITGRSLQILQFNWSAIARQVDLDSSQLQMAQTGPSGNAATAQGPAVELHYSQDQLHVQQTQFSAQALVRTEDGKEIKFQLELELTAYQSQHTQVDITNAAARQKKDPLVLNLDRASAELLDRTMQFDLNSDGHNLSIAQLAPGSAYLALDRNGDGKITQGRELFGPQSGDGFAELAQLDSDHNHWLDENDAVFGQLRLWRVDDQGGSLQSLKQAGIGALFLGAVDTPLSLQQDGRDLGDIAQTGFYLKEDGTGRSMQHVNLSV